MYLRHITGIEGENLATKYLINSEYKIIKRNFSCKQGEIDIIAQKDDEIIFVEVKTRRNKKYGEPIDAVTELKKNHLKKAIEYYLYINNLQDSFIRIDVIEIYQKGNSFLLHHIKQVI